MNQYDHHVVRSLLCLIFAGVCLSGQNPVPGLLKEAESLQAQGRYAEAVGAYNSALREQPKLYEALIGKGLALVKLGKGMEALEVCNEAVNERQEAPSFACRAESYEKIGTSQTTMSEWHQAAISDWQAVARLAPENRRAPLSLSTLYWAKGQKLEAIDALKKYLAGDPKDVALRMKLSSWLQQTGQHNEALAVLNEVLRLEPGHNEALRRRTEYYMSQGERGKALEDMKQLLHDVPEDAPGFFKRGELLASSGNYQAAWKDVRKAASLTKSTDEQKQWKELGRQYLLAWLTSERDDAKRVQMLDGLDAQAKSEYGPYLAEIRYISLRRTGRDDAALKVVDEALTHGKGNADMFLFAADRVSHAGDPRRVIAFARKGLQLATEKDGDAKRDLNYLMGAAYMQLNSFPEANTALRAAAAYPGQMGSRANLFLLLGYANYMMRRGQDALMFYTEALRIAGPHQAQVTKNIAAVKAEFQLQ